MPPARFFVTDGDKKFPLTLKTPPVDLSPYQQSTIAGCTYVNVDKDRVVGLVFNGKQATGRSLSPVPIQRIPVPQVKKAPVSPIVKTASIVPQNTGNMLDKMMEAAKQPQVVERIEIPCPDQDFDAVVVEFAPFHKSHECVHDMQGKYEKGKDLWIEKYGSDQLRMSKRFGCKCDKSYVIERATREFPEFKVMSEVEISEYEPDIELLKILKEYLTQNSRRVLAVHEVESHIKFGTLGNGTHIVLINRFLGMCDLVCPFERMHNVVEPD